ncbi:MAG: hypothetical protein V2J11_07600 [Desulfofustis sp.]|jgi:hypothetical protein|nr:hypothetical protein [Desulfofustis sp.]
MREERLASKEDIDWPIPAYQLRPEWEQRLLIKLAGDRLKPVPPIYESERGTGQNQSRRFSYKNYHYVLGLCDVKLIGLTHFPCSETQRQGTLLVPDDAESTTFTEEG